MPYENLVVVSWDVNTGPYHLPPKPDAALNKQPLAAYVGYRVPGSTTDARIDYKSQFIDLLARYQYTIQIINLAFTNVQKDKVASDSKTLKVFIAPEFLYRGAGGGYVLDLLNGFDAATGAAFGLGGAFVGLSDYLRSYVTSDSKFDNWLFVFGTSIGASFKVDAAKSGQPLSSDTLDKAEAYNFCVSQMGGKSFTKSGSNIVMKQYKSHIDFLRAYQSLAEIGANASPTQQSMSLFQDALSDEATTHLAPVPTTTSAPKPPVPTPSSFSLPSSANSNFSIEICLDYYKRRLASSGQRVNLQLVPSGGMSLGTNMNAISLKTSPDAGVAINCDGVRAKDRTQIYISKAAGGMDALANGSIVVAQRLTLSPGGALSVNISDPASPGRTYAVKDTDIWVGGAGAVTMSKPIACKLK